MRHWLGKGQDDKADTLARRAVDFGCLDPEVVRLHSWATAAAGTEAALRAAPNICALALAARKGSTEDAWMALAVWSGPDHLAGRLSRFRVRLETITDEEGRTVVRPVRRHHPAAPLARRPRFHPVG